MIPVKCPQCNKVLQIPDQFAGQSGKCNHCGTFLRVPPPIPITDFVPLITVTCPYCGTLQQTQATIGQQTNCTACYRVMKINRTLTSKLALIGAGMANLTIFFVSGALFLAMLAWLTLVGGCFFVGLSSAPQGFDQRGYLKENGNHIRTIEYEPNKTSEEIRAHAEGLYQTQGRIAAAYYYPKGSGAPADAVTLAAGVEEANNAIYNPYAPQWRYVFMRSFKGTIQFIDCAISPSHDLCSREP